MQDAELTAAKRRHQDARARLRNAMSEANAARDAVSAITRNRLNSAAATGDLDVCLRVASDVESWSGPVCDVAAAFIAEHSPAGFMGFCDLTNLPDGRTVVVPEVLELGRRVPEGAAQVLRVVLERFSQALDYPDTIAVPVYAGMARGDLTITRSTGHTVLTRQDEAIGQPVEVASGPLDEVLRTRRRRLRG